MALGLVAFLCLVLADLESRNEPPMFHVQDHLGGTRLHYAYYLRYLYPRPWWYVELARRWLESFEPPLSGSEP